MTSLAPPNAVGLREIARELGVNPSTITDWAKKGWVTVLQHPQRQGQQMLLDRASVLAYFNQRARVDRRIGRIKKRGRPRNGSGPRQAVVGRSRPSGSRSSEALTAAPPWPLPQAGRPAPLTLSSTSSSPPADPAPPAQTWATASLVQEYLDRCAALQLAPVTLATKGSRLSVFAREVPTLPARQADVVRYLLARKHNGQSTRDSEFRIMRTFLFWAEESDHQVPAPNLKTLSPGQPPAKNDPQTQDEFEQVLDLTRNPQHRLILQTLRYTGARRKAITTVLKENLQDTGFHAESKRKKGKALMEWHNSPTWLVQQIRVHADSHPGPFVFVGDDGRSPLNPNTVTHLVEQACRRAGVKKIHNGPHNLRHTFGSIELEESGGDLLYVMNLMNHADVKTTQLYAKPSATATARRFQEQHAAAAPPDLNQILTYDLERDGWMKLNGQQPLTEDLCRRLLNQLPSGERERDRDRVFVTTVLATGIRGTQALALLAADIHDDHFEVSTQYGRRRVPIIKPLRWCLLDLAIAPDRPLFRSRHGDPLSLATASLFLNKAFRRLGLPKGENLDLLRYTAYVNSTQHGGDLTRWQERVIQLAEIQSPMELEVR